MVSIEKIILKCTQNRADRRYPKISLLISDLKRALSEPNVDFVQLEQRVDNGSTVVITDDEINQLRSGSNKKVKDDNGKPDDDIDYLPPKAGNAVTIGSVVAGILHGFYGAAVAAVFTMTGNHHFAQLLQVFIHGDGQLSIVRN